MTGMIYRLMSRTFSPNGSAELVFVQKINDLDVNFPVKLSVEAFICPPYFRESEELIDEFDIEFENREIKSIDGQPIEEVFNCSKEVRITFKYAHSTEGEPVLLPASDEILESEIIE